MINITDGYLPSRVINKLVYSYYDILNTEGHLMISGTEVDNILLALLEKKASKEGKTVIAVKGKGVIVYELLRVKRLKKGF